MNERVNIVFAVERSSLLFVTWAIGLSAWSQPDCAIDLGPDITYVGNPIQINGPAGFSNYLWSTGAGSANIIVNTPGIYTCQVTYSTGNLVTNGTFSSGNNGFNTDFNYSSTLVTDGNYYIGTNAASYHPQFVGTGSGNFMIVNSGWPSAHFNVWCQTMNVCPEQTYTLSYRVRTISNSQPARLQWWVGGAMSGPEVTLPSFGGWQTVTHTWTSGAGQNTTTFCLRVMSGDGVGNDFGLDDISISSTVVLSDQVEVLVNTLPIELVSFTGEAIMGRNHLNWRTATERNNDHFRLLRSADLENWEEVIRVQGAGNSQTGQDYHAVDGMPLFGSNYYTLVQVDLDGTETRSPIVAVEHFGSGLFLSGPNPAPVGSSIQFAGSIDGMRVTDLLGRQVAHSVNGNALYIHAGEGIYVVTLQRGTLFRSERVVLE